MRKRYHSHTVNNKINHLHKRCLRVIYNDNISSFKKLPEKYGSVPRHNRNLQILVTEMLKVHKNIAPLRFTENLKKRNPNYQLRHTLHFSIPHVRILYNGTEIISFLGPKVQDIVPTELKEMKTLSTFKPGIKNWWPQNFPCRLCKQYLLKICFI